LNVCRSLNLPKTAQLIFMMHDFVTTEKARSR